MAFMRHVPNGNGGRRHNNGHNNNGNRPRYNNGGHTNAHSQGVARRSQSRLNQVFDSNGPDARVRGTALQIVEKYGSLARDAQSSGDRVLAQSYQQHAEHYQRLHNEIQEEHAAIEAERNAWRQQQTEQQQAEQLPANFADNPNNNATDVALADDTIAVNTASDHQRQPPLRHPRREQQQRTHHRQQAARNNCGDNIESTDVSLVQELPSFLSIPIQVPQMPPIEVPTEAVVTPRRGRPSMAVATMTDENTAPTEAVVTRPRRKIVPVVSEDDV